MYLGSFPSNQVPPSPSNPAPRPPNYSNEVSNPSVFTSPPLFRPAAAVATNFRPSNPNYRPGTQPMRPGHVPVHVSTQPAPVSVMQTLPRPFNNAQSSSGTIFSPRPSTLASSPIPAMIRPPLGPSERGPPRPLAPPISHSAVPRNQENFTQEPPVIGPNSISRLPLQIPPLQRPQVGNIPVKMNTPPAIANLRPPMPHFQSGERPILQIRPSRPPLPSTQPGRPLMTPIVRPPTLQHNSNRPPLVQPINTSMPLKPNQNQHMHMPHLPGTQQPIYPGNSNTKSSYAQNAPQQSMESQQPYLGQRDRYPVTQPQSFNNLAHQSSAPKVNPAMIPSVVAVLEADEIRFKESGHPFYTFSSVAENPPPLPSTRCVSIIDDGNSSTQFIRSTLNHVPVSEEICENSKIPLSLLIQPFASFPQNDVPLVDFGLIGPIRCNRCRAYINPHVQFIKGGRFFVCNLCGMNNEVPEEYYANLDMSGKRIDFDLRPELKFGTIDFVASKVEDE